MPLKGYDVKGYDVKGYDVKDHNESGLCNIQCSICHRVTETIIGINWFICLGDLFLS